MCSLIFIRYTRPSDSTPLPRYNPSDFYCLSENTAIEMMFSIIFFPMLNCGSLMKRRLNCFSFDKVKTPCLVPYLSTPTHPPPTFHEEKSNLYVDMFVCLYLKESFPIKCYKYKVLLSVDCIDKCAVFDNIPGWCCSGLQLCRAATTVCHLAWKLQFITRPTTWSQHCSTRGHTMCHQWSSQTVAVSII